MSKKTKTKVYNSMAQWRENLFPQLEKENRLAELKKDAGQLNSCSEYQYTLGIAVRPELVEGQID